MTDTRFDDVALQLSRQIMALVYGPMPMGGSCQLQAMIQVMITDAMIQATAEPARKGG